MFAVIKQVERCFKFSKFVNILRNKKLFPFNTKFFATLYFSNTNSPTTNGFFFTLLLLNSKQIYKHSPLPSLIFSNITKPCLINYLYNTNKFLFRSHQKIKHPFRVNLIYVAPPHRSNQFHLINQVHLFLSYCQQNQQSNHFSTY